MSRPDIMPRQIFVPQRRGTTIHWLICNISIKTIRLKCYLVNATKFQKEDRFIVYRQTGLFYYSSTYATPVSCAVTWIKWFILHDIKNNHAILGIKLVA